ncbi:hypothetical protein JOM56_008780 [Amanita muscaria]
MSHTSPYSETAVAALAGTGEREIEPPKDNAFITGMSNSDRGDGPLLNGEDEPEGALIEEDLPEQDDFLSYESEDDALRVAYATRYNLVLDSNVPHIAPHIVITPPEDNSQDYYTPWLNGLGPQWPTNLMVVIPPNALDHTLVYMDSFCSSRVNNQSAMPEAKAVFRLSKFKTFVSSLIHEHENMHNIVNALQRHHRKAAAFAASEAARSFLTCNEYRCPSEKPFRWTDPAEPFLQRKNQFRGTIVIESPSPFSVPHIIINEPPPQDPWIPWHNATNSPQDHGFGRYLVVLHRMVLYTNTPESSEDYWGSLFASPESENLDPQAYREDTDYGGNFHAEILHVSENVNIFDSFDESPWTAIMDRYSAALLKTQEPPFECSGAAGFDQTTEGVTYDDEDELPPFDDWYQSIATRIVTVAT